MVLAIATNNAALQASAAASAVNRDMEISMERLSTGKRVNAAPGRCSRRGDCL